MTWQEAYPFAKEGIWIRRASWDPRRKLVYTAGGGTTRAVAILDDTEGSHVITTDDWAQEEYCATDWELFTPEGGPEDPDDGGGSPPGSGGSGGGGTAQYVETVTKWELGVMTHRFKGGGWRLDYQFFPGPVVTGYQSGGFRSDWRGIEHVQTSLGQRGLLTTTGGVGLVGAEGFLEGRGTLDAGITWLPSAQAQTFDTRTYRWVVNRWTWSGTRGGPRYTYDLGNFASRRTARPVSGGSSSGGSAPPPGGGTVVGPPAPASGTHVLMVINGQQQWVPTREFRCDG